MRGRGFGRGGSGNRNDPFRSRPANTSRPPSMHVDDFMKMESNQQTNQTTQNTSTQPTTQRRDNKVHCLSHYLVYIYCNQVCQKTATQTKYISLKICCPVKRGKVFLTD